MCINRYLFLSLYTYLLYHIELLVLNCRWLLLKLAFLLKLVQTAIFIYFLKIIFLDFSYFESRVLNFYSQPLNSFFFY